MVENEIIARKMSPAEADVPQSLVVAYAEHWHRGVNSTAISQGMRAGFNSELFRKVDDTLNHLIELRRRCYPIPVDLRRVKECLRILDQIQEGEPITLTAPPQRRLSQCDSQKEGSKP